MSGNLKVTFDNSTVHKQYEGSAMLVPYGTIAETQNLGKLYVGDRDSAAFLQIRHRNCAYVVNCQQDLHGLSREKDVTYCNVDPDVSSKAYEESYQFIDKALSAGNNVTILCQTGLAKSAAILLYFLMKKMSTPMADSHRLLTEVTRKNNKTLNMKPDLIKQLIVLEKIVRKTGSISLDGRKVVYLGGGIGSFFSGFGGGKGGSKGTFPFVAFGVFVGTVGVLYGVLLYLSGGKM